MTARARGLLVAGAAACVLVASALVASAVIDEDDRPTNPGGDANAESSTTADRSPDATTDVEREAPTTSRPDTFWVAPSGDDDDDGTEDAPFRTMQHALEQLRPGDTLLVGDGTYEEQVSLPGDVLVPGRPDAPIVVEAAPGARPVIEGLLRLTGADHWTLRGINVTWDDDNDDDDHMVQFLGGTEWRITDAELWGAKSFSALNVDAGATEFRIDGLYVHDTERANDRNQDHLIYIASGNRGGVIERNLLVGSPNGRGIKVGPGSLSEPGSDDLVIRYNTFVDNLGPSNLRFSGESSGSVVERNLMVRSESGEAAVTAFELSGSDNVVRDNAAWKTEGVVEGTDGLVDGGGNIEVDPQFDEDASGRQRYRPTDPVASRYGVFAEEEG